MPAFTQQISDFGRILELEESLNITRLEIGGGL